MNDKIKTLKESIKHMRITCNRNFSKYKWEQIKALEKRVVELENENEKRDSA